MEIKQVFQTPPDGSYFSGYYDKRVVSGEKLVCLCSPRLDYYPGEDSESYLCIFQLEDGRCIDQKRVNVFNWQTGNMAEFAPSFGANVVGYNMYINGRVRYCLTDIKNNELVTSAPTFFAFSDKGRVGAIVDMDMLSRLRPGYSLGKTQYDLHGITNAIGFFSIDYEKILSRVAVDDLLKVSATPVMRKSFNYLEHPIFSPCGKYCCFIHRWRPVSDEVFARLVIVEVVNGRFKVVETGGRVGHFNWTPDGRLIGYIGDAQNMLATSRGNIKSKFVRKWGVKAFKLLVKQDGLAASKIRGDSYKLSSPVKNLSDPITFNDVKHTWSSLDGHPSVIEIKQRNLVVTDTYSIKGRGAKLLIGDIYQDQLDQVTTFYSDPNFDSTPWRCDLHPKAVNDSGKIVVDHFYTTGKTAVSIYECEYPKGKAVG